MFTGEPLWCHARPDHTAVFDDEVVHRGVRPDRRLALEVDEDLQHLADERGAVGHQAPDAGAWRLGAQEHPRRDGERSRRPVEVLHRAQLVGLDHEPVVLGHGRLDLVTPLTERGGVVRDSLDRAAGRVAALVVRVVVAPAGAPDQPNSLAQQEVDHLEPAVRNVSRRAGDDASPMSPIDVVEIRQPVFVRVGVCPPRASAGCSAATPCRRTFRWIRREAPASRRPAVRSPRRRRPGPRPSLRRRCPR